MTDNTLSIIYIQMIHNRSTIVDSVDADLQEFHWGIKKADHKEYAKREITVIPQIKGIQKRKRKEIAMHRLILERMLGRELVRGEECDHINGNSLDNQRNNLRLATQKQNAQNSKKHHDSTSGYKGVYFFKPIGKWSSSICANGTRYSLGYFDTAEEAHEVYCKAAIELHGEFARLE